MMEASRFLAEAGPNLACQSDLWRRTVNTFLSFPFLFDMVVGDSAFDDLLQNRQKRDARYLFSRFLQKSLWFWPRIIDAKIWTEGDVGKDQTPENFITFDESSRALCDAVDRYVTSKDAPVLDLGCNVGRHLDNLRARGFTNLTGVDAMGSALRRLAIEFPQTASEATLHHDLFQRFLRCQPVCAFDVVYSHGATIELVHPSFDITAHLCRIASNHVILILNESYRGIYPRFWYHEFARQGFFLREALRPVGNIPPRHLAETPSLLVFARYRSGEDS